MQKQQREIQCHRTEHTGLSQNKKAKNNGYPTRHSGTNSLRQLSWSVTLPPALLQSATHINAAHERPVRNSCSVPYNSHPPILMTHSKQVHKNYFEAQKGFIHITMHIMRHPVRPSMHSCSRCRYIPSNNLNTKITAVKRLSNIELCISASDNLPWIAARYWPPWWRRSWRMLQSLPLSCQAWQRQGGHHLHSVHPSHHARWVLGQKWVTAQGHTCPGSRCPECEHQGSHWAAALGPCWWGRWQRAWLPVDGCPSPSSALRRALLVHHGHAPGIGHPGWCRHLFGWSGHTPLVEAPSVERMTTTNSKSQPLGEARACIVPSSG